VYDGSTREKEQRVYLYVKAGKKIGLRYIIINVTSSPSSFHSE